MENGKPKLTVVRPEDQPVQVIKAPNCKLCSLSDTNPDFLDVIYQWKFGDNLDYREIIERSNAVIERDKIEMRPLQLANLSVHFNKHIPVDAATIYSLQEAASKKRKHTVGDPDVLNKLVAIKRQSLEKIEENALKWQRLYEALFHDLHITETTDGLPTLATADERDAKEIETLVNAMSKAHATWADLIKAKETLLKERGFVLEVMRQAVDFYGRSFAVALGERALSAREAVKTTEPDQAVLVDSLFEAFMSAVKDTLTGLYDITVKEISDRYAL